MNEDGHVLKSRRGLLAAGLVAAVIGGLGVASTLNAGAGQIPGSVGGRKAAAAAPTLLTPPARLPWGSVPRKIKKGRGGESSSDLRADGADAAPADTSGSTKPEDAFAPKGRAAKNTYLKTETTDVKPPLPTASRSASAVVPPAAAASDAANFLYNLGSQAAVADGLYATMTVAKPELATQDFHTLAEVAVESADGKQIVEVGWNVDRSINGDDDPHLFVYHWVNQATSCYNGCGYVQYATDVKPGDTLTYDVAKKFGIQYTGGAWWILFDTEFIGYFPGTLWSDAGVTFTQGGFLQVFGEVAAASAINESCTDMGNSSTPDLSTSAFAASVNFINGPTVSLSIRSTTDFYKVNALSTKTFRYGGPGTGPCPTTS